MARGPAPSDDNGMTRVRILRATLAVAAVAAAATGPAHAAPISDLTARYGGGTLHVAAGVASPPDSTGCRVSVTARWNRAGSAVSGRGRGTDAGLVTKSTADGAVSADGCQRIGERARWTEGTARLQFRPGDMAPGAYRVCLTASAHLADGRDSVHVACTGFRVAPSRPEAKRGFSRPVTRR